MTAPLTLRDRIRGCLLGGAVGDALGAGIEYATLAQIRERFGPAGVRGYLPAYGVPVAITDDTQLTLFTAEGLIRASVRADHGIVHVPSMLWAAYQRWLWTQGELGVVGEDDRHSWLADEPVLHRRRSPGRTCMLGLRRRADEPLPPDCVTSQGNGALVRSAPFGLFGVSRDRLAPLAVECARLTHGHPTAGHAAAVLAVTLDRVVHGGETLTHAVTEAAAEIEGLYPDAQPTVSAVRRAVEAARRRPPGRPQAEEVEALGAGWVAAEALAIAVFCALVAPDVRSALLLAVNHSGDSDATGSLCGQLLGAAHGDQALPPDWVADVEARGVVLQLADDLYYEIARRPELHGDGGPRTSWTRRYPG